MSQRLPPYQRPLPTLAMPTGSQERGAHSLGGATLVRLLLGCSAVHWVTLHLMTLSAEGLRAVQAADVIDTASVEGW